MSDQPRLSLSQYREQALTALTIRDMSNNQLWNIPKHGVYGCDTAMMMAILQATTTQQLRFGRLAKRLKKGVTPKGVFQYTGGEICNPYEYAIPDAKLTVGKLRQQLAGIPDWVPIYPAWVDGPPADTYPAVLLHGFIEHKPDKGCPEFHVLVSVKSLEDLADESIAQERSQEDNQSCDQLAT